MPPATTDKVTYPDNQTKYTEAAAAFEQLANDYSDYRDVGHYYAGLSYLQISPDKGIPLLEALSAGTSDVRAEATLGLAEYYDKAGTYDQAEQYYQKLADNPGKLPRMYVLNQLAAVKERLNKNSEAAALYKTVVDVDRNSAYGTEAEKGLQRVDPAAAAALPPKAPSGNPSNTIRGNKPGAPMQVPALQ
jgi:tetratricopeptide (TPR) repeat protein